MTGFDRIDASAEVSQCSAAPLGFCVHHTDRGGRRHETTFYGPDAGKRAYAWASAVYTDVKSGAPLALRPALPVAA